MAATGQLFLLQKSSARTAILAVKVSPCTAESLACFGVLIADGRPLFMLQLRPETAKLKDKWISIIEDGESIERPFVRDCSMATLAGHSEIDLATTRLILTHFQPRFSLLGDR